MDKVLVGCASPFWFLKKWLGTMEYAQSGAVFGVQLCDVSDHKGMCLRVNPGGSKDWTSSSCWLWKYMQGGFIWQSFWSTRERLASSWIERRTIYQKSIYLIISDEHHWHARRCIFRGNSRVQTHFSIISVHLHGPSRVRLWGTQNVHNTFHESKLWRYDGILVFVNDSIWSSLADKRNHKFFTNWSW